MWWRILIFAFYHEISLKQDVTSEKTTIKTVKNLWKFFIFVHPFIVQFYMRELSNAKSYLKEIPVKKNTHTHKFPLNWNNPSHQKIHSFVWNDDARVTGSNSVAVVLFFCHLFAWNISYAIIPMGFSPSMIGKINMILICTCRIRLLWLCRL